MTTLSTSKPQPNTEVDAAALSSNFTAIETVINGSLDTSNWGSGKVFPVNKLQQGGANTGDVLMWNGTDWDPEPTVGYSTSLPGSPVDGQNHILVDSTTAPTYVWHFRYISGIADSYKWLCLGGSPLRAEVHPDVDFGAGDQLAENNHLSYAAATTAGPTITIPRAGIYVIGIGFKVNGNISGAPTFNMSYDIGGTGALERDGVQSGGGSNVNPSAAKFKTKTIASASTALTSKYKTQTNSTGNWQAYIAHRWLQAMPLRVA